MNSLVEDISKAEWISTLVEIVLLLTTLTFAEELTNSKIVIHF